LVVWPQFGNRLLTMGRDGSVSGFVGGASNGPSEGRGTNVTFAQITQCVAAPNGDVFMLQAAAETNGVISRISPDGDVSTVFRGLLVVSNVMTRVAGGWISPVDLHMPVQRLAVDAGGGLLAGLTYSEAIPSNNPLIREDRERSAWFRILADGTTASPDWPITLFRADESVLDDDYRLQNGTIVRVEDGFSLKVLGAGSGSLTSAYRSADGTFWAVESGGGVYRMSPAPAASFLTVKAPSADVQVEGVPARGINPDEVIQLQVVSKSGFWTLARWSDGATNNPRTLSINRDTTLSFEINQRPPLLQGLSPKSVRMKSPGTVTFSVIGPGEDNFTYPYRYLLEWSPDLKDWKAAKGLKTVAGFGQISGNEVTAEKPRTPVEFTLPDTTDRWFLRATLKY
jgi:hypothetical protein